MPYMPGIWRMYSSSTGSESPNQRKVIFMPLILQRSHRQSLDDGFAHEEGEDGYRQDDQRRSGADAGPVDLAVGNEVIHRHRHGFGLRPGEDQRKQELVPRENEGH